MSLNVTKLKRKSLVRGKEESATQRMDRQRFTRSVSEQRFSKMEDTTLTSNVTDKDGKVVSTPRSQAYELARAGVIATGGWHLGKTAPVTKENILAFKRYVNICSIMEQDLGKDHPTVQYMLRKLQNHFLTLFPRSVTIDEKDINIVETQPNMADVLKQMYGDRLGMNLPIATDLKKTQNENVEAEE